MAVQRVVTLGVIGLSIGLFGGGCDRVFSLEAIAISHDAGMAVTSYDRCAPVAADPLRYTVIYNPHSAPDGAWSWAEARVECLRRGMDLAVMNDASELSSAEIEVRPYWVGTSSDGAAWSSVDGCTPIAPAGVSGLQCGYVTGDSAIAGASCNGKVSATEVVEAALCESPRPTIDDCGIQDPADISYKLSETAMSYAEARAYCSGLGGHLTVVDSYAELRHLAKLAISETYPSVWIGATFDNRTWQSDTTCPGLYSWTGGQPAFDVSTSCVATTMEMDPEGGEDGISGGMHMSGMTPKQCIEPTRALCELAPVTLD